MLLSITYTGQNTPELGYLLYKNPNRPQVFELNHGKAYVFYPEVSNERTTAALLLDIDPLDLARGKSGQSRGLFDYVNDRPYVASSFMSTAISRVFGTAMTGRADSRQALSDSPLELAAGITMLPCRGERDKLNAIFEPLGYEVRYETFMADEQFPDWGDSDYVNLTISGKVRLRDLLKHLFVLLPVFDRQKHYWIGEAEVEKLLRMGEGWLQEHPERQFITRRYLNRRRTLVNMAFERLAANAAEENMPAAEPEVTPERKPRLNEQRLDAVMAALKNSGAKSVLDLGCGEGKLLDMLVKDGQFTRIAGADVSSHALGRASERLHLERAGEAKSERIQLFQGAITYKDARFSGYEAVSVVEVIEHLDIPRLAAFERVLFEFAKPRCVVLTTPNREYNVHYGIDNLRHGDHRFEWTRTEFQSWASETAERFGYTVQFSDIGESDESCGAPTQMGVFMLCNGGRSQCA